MPAALVNIAGIAVVAVAAELAVQLVQHDLGKTDDGVERRAQLVTHVGEELGLGAVGGLRLVASGRQLQAAACLFLLQAMRSEENTSELQSLMRISYVVFLFKKKRSIEYY